jgi:hypothetical protein
MELKLGLPLSLILVNALFCIRFQTWKAYQNLAPVTAAKNYLAARRGEKMINLFRISGLLVLLFAGAFAHGQGTNGTNNSRGSRNTVHRSAAYETPFVAGVIRDGDTAAATSWGWNAQMGMQNVQYSRGDDAVLNPHYVWTDRYEDSTGYPWLDKTGRYVWKHVGTLLVFAFVIFLVLQFGRGGEANETNIHDQLDPEYRTGFTSDYHGDDAFEVPDGMHSEHEPVPVRARSARAGR